MVLCSCSEWATGTGFLSRVGAFCVMPLAHEGVVDSSARTSEILGGVSKHR